MSKMIKSLIILPFFIFSCCYVNAQVKVEVIVSNGYGNFHSEELEYDSIIECHNKSMIVAGNGKLIQINMNDIASVSLPNSDFNQQVLNNIKDEHSDKLKRNYVNGTIGFFATGAVLILAADPLKYLVTKNLKIGTDETLDGFSKRVTNTGNAIYWSMMGVGTIFEIVGMYRTIKLASGKEFGYGITNNGITLKYTFK